MRLILTTVEAMRVVWKSWLNQDFAFDVETTGTAWTKDDLCGISLSFADGHSYYIVIKHTIEQADGSVIVTDFISPSTVRAALKPLFDQTHVKMVAHNSKFDMHFLDRILGIRVCGMLTDTLLQAKLLNENRPNGLKELAHLVGPEYTKYQELASYKGYKKNEFLGVPLELAADYAMSDAEATFKLEQRFSQELANEQLQDAYYDLWQPMIHVLFEMERSGIGLDINLIHRLLAKYEEIEKDSYRTVRKAGLEYILQTYTSIDEIPALYWEIYRGENYLEDSQGPFVYDLETGVRLPLYRPTARSAYRVLSFNPGSSKQLSDLVFKQTRIEVPPLVKLKRNSQGEFAVDKDNIETLLFYAGADRPVVLDELLRWKKATKFISTYLKRFEKDADRNNEYSIYTSFNQDGTDTGRLSSSGPNLQNIPSRGDVGAEAREVFVKRRGKTLIAADYSMMELRVMAHYSKDQQLLAAFAENKDLHILTGAAFAQMTYDDLLALYQSGDPKGKELRQLGKTGNFALMYGMGAAKFKRYLLVNNKYDITIKQAQDWIDSFNLMYIGATQWKIGKPYFDRRTGQTLPSDYPDDGKEHHWLERRGGVYQAVARLGYVQTISKRKRRLPEAFAAEQWQRARAQRQAVNAIIQGSCGDIICSAMLEIQPQLMALGGSLLLQVHDELIAEVPEEHAEAAINIINHCMNHTGYVTQLSVPLIAEANAGDSWSQAKGH